MFILRIFAICFYEYSLHTHEQSFMTMDDNEETLLYNNCVNYTENDFI